MRCLVHDSDLWKVVTASIVTLLENGCGIGEVSGGDARGKHEPRPAINCLK